MYIASLVRITGIQFDTSDQLICLRTDHLKFLQNESDFCGHGVELQFLHHILGQAKYSSPTLHYQLSLLLDFYQCWWRPYTHSCHVNAWIMQTDWLCSRGRANFRHSSCVFAARFGVETYCCTWFLKIVQKQSNVYMRLWKWCRVHKQISQAVNELWFTDGRVCTHFYWSKSYQT